ncbi:FAD-dependent oxidoreductase [Desulfovibrio psychrotolerans]|uniref:Thioredoxin reductase n=1 Tax=Desulfovibrio psychrotolerans TaxID=415242 RepID=A0A7J0BRR5_9BACT|nr:FAD-dependent oxidoreductase [Desulfovibrio psychrotolerans]GFM36379.1 thioredoxin reductase [Desulfovibrio psychrotolerans]
MASAHTPGTDHDWLIPEEGQKHLKDVFKSLKGTVRLVLFTSDEPDNQFNLFATRFAADLALLSDKIVTERHALDSDTARRHDVTLGPTLLVNPDDYRIRFTGAPLGEEARALIETIMLISLGVSGLSAASRQILDELDGLDEQDRQRHPRVFSSPGCPYCPGQFMNAVKCAIAKPQLVSAECVDSDEFPDLSARYGVGSVPHTAFSETHSGIGLMPEERFVLELVALKGAEDALRERGLVQDGPAHPEHDMAVEEYDIIILGAGPAGLTAGIYAERSGLRSIVLDKSIIGGQVAVTPVVENYPGFKNVGGMNLVEILTAHTREYANVRENEPVEEVKLGRQIEVFTPKAVYLGKALVFATGSQWRSLGVPGEKTYYANGVSYCASCDGFGYRGKKVLMVGGGNSALTDALHLKNLGVDVTIVHRRDSFRAEKALQDSLTRESIPVIWNTTVEEIVGEDGRVTGAVLRDTAADKTFTFACDGVFVAIGHVANTELASQIGIVLNADGTIKVDRSMRSNIPRVYAAGDVTGGVRQIVTAVGEGATAALSAFEDIQNPYWKKSG